MANDKGMDGSFGMSPRKAIAAGLAHPGSDFDVKTMPTGGKPDSQGGELSDDNRGAGSGVVHTKGMLPAQSAPDHGPVSDKGWLRGGKA